MYFVPLPFSVKFIKFHNEWGESESQKAALGIAGLKPKLACALSLGPIQAKMKCYGKFLGSISLFLVGEKFLGISQGATLSLKFSTFPMHSRNWSIFKHPWFSSVIKEMEFLPSREILNTVTWKELTWLSALWDRLFSSHQLSVALHTYIYKLEW